MMIQVELNKIRIDEKRGEQIIVLKEKNGDKKLPIVIGIIEATAIKMKVVGYDPPRPLTHDLFNEVINELNAKLEKVVIEKLDNNIFYAKLFLKDANNDIKKIDARPSDSIALALRADADIFVEESVLENAQYKGI